MRNRLIVIEGIDGSGKATQVELMRATLEGESILVKSVFLTMTVTAPIL